MPGSKGFESVRNVPTAGFKRPGSNRWVRWSHVLADNAQMRAHARRVRAHLDAQGQKLDGAATAVEELAEQFADDGRGEEQARMHIEGFIDSDTNFLRSHGVSGMSGTAYERVVEWAALNRYAKGASRHLKGNIPNPIKAEIERTVDDLVGVSRLAGEQQFNLTIRGEKRHAKAELKRINKIVDQVKQHLLDGIAAIQYPVGHVP
ncbi:hypothetical protein [Rhizobium sp. Kim5]|uniref:hypothetical protein n=1 Tax=Rhizobium sp. Kim5 TaxID=2020311 RepID=UPI000F73F65F|nr:hypothetical protein [Rhizobium sp. Kim5]